MKRFLLSLFILLQLSTTASSRPLNIDSLSEGFLYNSKFIDAHVGISIFNLDNNKSVYHFQANKKFLPASNLKLFIAYLSLKYLRKELAAFEYIENQNTLIILPCADPTFLYKSFSSDKVLDFLSQKKYKKIILNTSLWRESPYSAGWVWDDYQDDFMSEKSCFPLYGNTANFEIKNGNLVVLPSMFQSKLINCKIDKNIVASNHFKITRDFNTNTFTTTASAKTFKHTSVPLLMSGHSLTANMLSLLLNKKVELDKTKIDNYKSTWTRFYNTPTLDALKVMMKESDNFIAEHLLLMLSKEVLGYMNTQAIIQKTIETDFQEFARLHAWKDASGLSRYNLISSNEMNLLLQKMANEFGFEKASSIFPTGNEGTLKNYFIDYGDMIFAKTGSMNNTFALSGFFIGKATHQKHSFSIMINGCAESTPTTKKEIEKYLSKLIDHL